MSVSAEQLKAPARAVREKSYGKRVALWIFAALALIYLSTANGILLYGDDVSMYEVTQGIVERGTFAVPPRTPGASPGVGGDWYSKYGVGESLLGVPFYLVGRLAMRVSPHVAIVDGQGFVRADTLVYIMMVLGMLCTAATASLLYLTCKTLGFGDAGALLAAFGLGLGTFAWHYARTFMSEPASMCSLLVAYYGLLRFRENRGESWLLLSGAAAATGLLLRISNAVAVAPLAVWLIWEIWSGHWDRLRKGLAELIAWGGPVTVAVFCTGIYDFERFRSVTETGYQAEALAFTTPVYVGLYGFFLSSGKSIFLYAPILVPGVLGWLEVRRRQPAAAFVAAGMALFYAVFYARWYQWYGGGGWGPRFLVVVLPFFALGLAAIVPSRRNIAGWVALVAFGACSVFIQIVSVLVPYVPYEAKVEATPSSFERLLWNPAYSPVLAETRSFLSGQYPWDVAPHYYASPFLAGLQISAFAIGMVVLVVGIVTWARPLLTHRDRPKPSG